MSERIAVVLVLFAIGCSDREVEAHREHKESFCASVLYDLRRVRDHLDEDVRRGTPPTLTGAASELVSPFINAAYYCMSRSEEEEKDLSEDRLAVETKAVTDDPADVLHALETLANTWNDYYDDDGSDERVEDER